MSDSTSSASLINAITLDTIGELEPHSAISLSENAPLMDAIKLMRMHKMGAVLVVNEAEKLTGILTERDIVLKVVGQDIPMDSTPVKDYMTLYPESLAYDDKIIYALNRMTLGGYRHIPLTDEDGSLTGIISVKDIVEYLVGLVEKAVLDLT